MPSFDRRPIRPAPRARHLVRCATGLALAASCLAGCAAPHGTPLPGAGVAVLPEHYTHSLAALGWPGARRAFQVGHGSVVSSGECALEWRLVSAGDSSVTSPVWFERDGVPVAHWIVAAPWHSVEFEAAAAPQPGLGDTSLVLSVSARATWHGSAPGTVALEVRVRGTPDGPHVVPWDAPDDTVFAESWRGAGAYRNDRLVTLVDPAARRAPDAPTTARPATTAGSGPGRLVARCEARLAPGEQRTWEFLVPLYPQAARDRGALRGVTHERVASAARRFWRARLAEAATLETPDSLVRLAWRAALVTLVASQERSADRWVPLGNPFQYRDVWLRDGARVVRALAEAGLTDLARDDARTLARFQLPTGVLLSQRGQLDGVGQGLWALEQAAALPPSPAFAREALPVAERALRWIERERRYSVHLDLPWPGMLPFADPRDGELVRAQLVGNDAWAIAGCRAVAALAARAGEPGLCAEAETTGDRYASDFRAALAHTRSADLPPSWQGTGRDWGNAAIGYPTGALEASDPRLARLAARMRAHAVGTGLVCYGLDDSLHTYLGADLAQWSLLAGRPAEARDWLRGVLAHSNSTLGQAEIVARDGGFGTDLPPHATAAAALVDLLRNMVLDDGRDTLELARGVLLDWWSGTRLERAPTRFGVTSVRLDRPAADLLRVRLEPLPVPVRVRAPEGTRARQARSPGARLVDGTWVEAPAGAREIVFSIVEESRQ